MNNAINIAASMVEVFTSLIQEHLTTIACVAILGAPVAAITAGYIL